MIAGAGRATLVLTAVHPVWGVPVKLWKGLGSMKRHKTVLLADGSEEFRWLVWKCAGEHTYFSMKTVGSGWDIMGNFT